MANNRWSFGDGVKTASALIASGRCVLHGIIGVTDAANDMTLQIYNNTDDSANQALPSIVIDSAVGFDGLLGLDLVFNTGIYVKMTTSGTGSFTVLFAKD
jgi:hypothetical protein